MSGFIDQLMSGGFQVPAIVHYAEQENAFSTSQSVYQTAFSTSTPDLPAGNYLVMVSCECEAGLAAPGQLRVEVDNDASKQITNNLRFVEETPSNPYAGLRRVALAAGAHTIDFDILSTVNGVSVIVRRMRVTVFKV